MEVVITVLEGDEDGWWGDKGTQEGNGAGWGLLNVLAGCITVAGAAIVDAGIDCVDVVSGGVAAVIRNPETGNKEQRVLDPCPAEHQDVIAACAVGYLASRDEITELWMKGDMGTDPDGLIEGATHAAVGSMSVVKEVLLETMEAKFKSHAAHGNEGTKRKQSDIEMTG